MAPTTHIVTSFPLRETTPPSILWEGVIEINNPDKLNAQGYPELVLKTQCKLINGSNGLFVAAPSQKSPEGEFFPIVKYGPGIQGLLRKAIEEQMGTEAAAPPPPPPPPPPLAEPPVPAAQDDFSDDLPF